MSVEAMPTPARLPDLAPPVAPAPLQGSGRVLVVDDDDAVRMMVAHSVERMGFRVVQARDGASALAQMQGGASPIVTAVVDLRMPGMDGIELMRRIRAIRPAMPVILTSGYYQPDSGTPPDPKVPTRFLHKPYTLAALTSELRSVLNP